MVIFESCAMHFIDIAVLKVFYLEDIRAQSFEDLTWLFQLKESFSPVVNLSRATSTKFPSEWLGRVPFTRDVRYC